MAFVHANRPSGTGFFVFPMDEQNLQSNIPHDFARPYTLADVQGALSPKAFELLRSRVGSGSLHLIGLWPDDAVVKKFEVIAGGETIFFVTKSMLVGVGTIIHAERSRELAAAVFGRSYAGNELLIFMVEPQELALPLAKFNEALGRKGSSTFRSFSTLSTAQIRNIEESHGSFYAFLESAKPPAESEAAEPAEEP